MSFSFHKVLKISKTFLTKSVFAILWRQTFLNKQERPATDPIGEGWRTTEKTYEPSYIQ